MNQRLVSLLAAALLALGVQTAFADDARFSMDYRNARLEDVLRALAIQGDVGLVTPGVMNGSVTLKLSNVTLDEALRHLADATGITYARAGKVLTVNPQGISTRTFPIHYVSAAAVRDAIVRVLSPLGTVDVFNGAAKDDQGKTGELVPGNQIVVRDNDAKLDEVAQVVAALDKRPRQVEIEAKLVEVTLTNDDKMGINWHLAASLQGAAMPTTFPFDRNAGGGSFTPTPIVGPPGSPFPYNSSSDYTFGKLSASEFKVALAFLASRKNTNLVRSPKISTLENKPAEILVGTVVPIAIYQYSQQTGVLQLSGYEEKRIGVKLNVNPRVSDDGRILMSVHPEISEILEYRGQFNERPVTSNREATAEIMVKDGETMVIGGLTKTLETVTENKVPFLGSIPGLGALFTSKEKAKEKVELVVFVTAHLIPE